MGKELGVFKGDFVCAFDEAQFFYSDSVEAFAVEGAQVLCVIVEYGFEIV
jgi:hypothetical protein